MQARGYSLVEMVLVMAVIGILLGIGTLSFRDYAQRAQMESQTRVIFEALQKARAKAVYERRKTQVNFFSDHFDAYSSLAGSGVAPVATQKLAYPVTVALGYHNTSVVFANTGITSDLGSICLAQYPNDAPVDSVVIHFVRTSLGKKDKDDCASDYITKQ
jgi:prepilin-type N-terminal cleavage/methylation domain-containing protein